MATTFLSFVDGGVYEFQQSLDNGQQGFFLSADEAGADTLTQIEKNPVTGKVLATCKFTLIKAALTEYFYMQCSNGNWLHYNVDSGLIEQSSTAPGDDSDNLSMYQFQATKTANLYGNSATFFLSTPTEDTVQFLYDNVPVDTGDDTPDGVSNGEWVVLAVSTGAAALVPAAAAAASSTWMWIAIICLVAGAIYLLYCLYNYWYPINSVTGKREAKTGGSKAIGEQGAVAVAARAGGGNEQQIEENGEQSQ